MLWPYEYTKLNCSEKVNGGGIILYTAETVEKQKKGTTNFMMIT